MTLASATTALALIALVPMMTGQLPGEERGLIIALCAGGAIELPLGDGDEEPGHDCPAVGCHSTTGREKVKTPKAL